MNDVVRKTDYDLIIAGAGMVGATLACALSGQGLTIAMVEAGQRPADRWPEGSVDLRVSAITEASQHIFEHLDVWSSLQSLGVSPYRAMYVWDAGGPGKIHFDCSDVGAAQLGYIIENRNIQSVLLSRLSTVDDVDIFYHTHITATQADTQQISVRLNDDRQLTARLLIGADGANSSVRQMAGIDTSGWGYQQHAVVTVVETERPHQETAWQRFLPNGPLAFLPLADGRSSIVWSTSPEQARELLHCSDDEFCVRVGTAFDNRLGRVTDCLQRLSFPLRRRHADHYTRQRIALIGDAAHTIHPLAGQGVNLGLLDAAALAEVIHDGYNRGIDFGMQRSLRRYERWRRGDNLTTMTAMDGFKYLFSNDSKALGWIRGGGLDLTDRIPALKKILTGQAMGRKRDLPSMTRPC